MVKNRSLSSPPRHHPSLRTAHPERTPLLTREGQGWVPNGFPGPDGSWYPLPVKRIAPGRTVRTRQLRAEATAQERAIWTILSPYRPRFTRQLTVGPYTADLACRRARLLIELDGSQHAGSAHDERRTRVLSGQGWTVIRFWNSDVNTNPQGVAEAILLKVRDLTGIEPQARPPRTRSKPPDSGR